MPTATDTPLLDCGHAESPHSEITKGYGTDENGETHCYDCCLQRDLDTMTRNGEIMAYLSSDGRHVTNWPGSMLATVVGSPWVTSAGGWARNSEITRFEAIAANGSRWYGRGPGKGMYTRLRRYKVAR